MTKFLKNYRNIVKLLELVGVRVLLTYVITLLLCSTLEKAKKELEPEEDLINPRLLYPAFAVSMIVNLLMGGHILSQVGGLALVICLP